MCLSVWKANTQNITVWNKKSFIDGEGASQEDGRPTITLPQIHLAHCTKLRVFKGLMWTGLWKCWWDKFWLEDLGTWLLWQIGVNTDFLNNRPFCFWKDSNVYVLVMSWFFDSMSACVVGEELWFWVELGAGGQSSLLWACFDYMTCGFCLLSLKSKLVSP